MYVLQLNSNDGQTNVWLVGINLLGRVRQFLSVKYDSAMHRVLLHKPVAEYTQRQVTALCRSIYMWHGPPSY
jgi:hypothetical protein